MWRVNDILLHNEWDNNDVKEEIKRYLNKHDYENTMTKNL